LKTEREEAEAEAARIAEEAARRLEEEAEMKRVAEEAAEAERLKTEREEAEAEAARIAEEVEVACRLEEGAEAKRATEEAPEIDAAMPAEETTAAVLEKVKATEDDADTRPIADEVAKVEPDVENSRVNAQDDKEAKQQTADVVGTLDEATAIASQDVDDEEVTYPVSKRARLSDCADDGSPVRSGNECAVVRANDIVARIVAKETVSDADHNSNEIPQTEAATADTDDAASEDLRQVEDSNASLMASKRSLIADLADHNDVPSKRLRTSVALEVDEVSPDAISQRSGDCGSTPLVDREFDEDAAMSDTKRTIDDGEDQFVEGVQTERLCCDSPLASKDIAAEAALEAEPDCPEGSAAVGIVSEELLQPSPVKSSPSSFLWPFRFLARTPTKSGA